ncbi:hypothetical protein KVR01_012186 [Diaporthe batatas]|uniref:uncharacterized protein n=1 Tax=Diaporthe batatas TaxID=748121 RepID=UPI001D03D5F0|nr:uncharacterized protein KVR01_012186 [Diaporthe batatas]KAG8157914.1 hypothetical protein KVR01_012186 [Diaporthe batatas]
MSQSSNNPFHTSNPFHSPQDLEVDGFEEIELGSRAAPRPGPGQQHQQEEQHGDVDPDESTEHNEPTLVVGQDVFRNRQRLLEQRRMIALALGAAAVLLLTSTVTLAILYGKLLRHGHDAAPQPTTVATTVTIHHTATPTTISSATLTTPVTTVTNIALSPAAPKPTQCWPGSVWGGADLKEVNEDYTTLMAVALGTSQLGRLGIATDYDLVALRSIFLCGMSMAPGELQVLDVCKGAYVSKGDGTRCDDQGSELRDGKVVATSTR